jgi:hypothetical protein
VGVLSALPVLTLGCCLWLVAGGASAAAFYRRRLHAPLISGTAGAKVGAATGGVAFAFFCITQAAVMLLAGERYREAFRQEMQRRAGADPSAMELLSNPAALAVLITIGVVIILFAFLIFAAIGGALGASVSRQRSR